MSVLLHNISMSGALIETLEPLHVGEVISLELPLAGITAATIVWSSEQLHGCQFKEPISKGAVSAARLQGQAAHAVSEAREAVPIGERLRTFRKARGISLKALGRALGVSSVTVYNWEAGKRYPRAGRMNAIAQALGIAPDDLTAAMGEKPTIGPEPNPLPVRLGSDLKAYLTEVKWHIAEGANVSFDNVTISITY